MNKRLQRRYGDAVACRFIDVDSSEVASFPSVVESLRRNQVQPPIVAIGGKVRYHGVFSPTFIQRDVKQLLGEAKAPKPPRPASRADIVGRAGFATSVVRSRTHRPS